MDDLQLRHLAIVLSNIKDATVDWAQVVEARGTTRKDNATRDFKVMMKKYGIEYNNNKFSIIEDSAIANPTSEKKPKATTPRKRKAKATEEKTDEGNDESASPKKKAKGKKAAEVEAEAANEATDDEDE